MKSWTYSINSHPDWRKGSIDLLDQPWWLALLEFSVSSLGRLYRPLNRIPLPNIRKRQRDLPHSQKLYGWADWYGSLGDLFIATVFNPALTLVFRLQQPYEVSVEIGYDKVRELFAARDPEFFAGHEHADTPDAEQPATHDAAMTEQKKK